MKPALTFAYIACIVIFLVSATSAISGDDVRLTIFVTAPEQQDSPAQIVGFKQPSKNAGHATVLFRNASTKEIRNLVIAGVVGNANDPDSISTPMVIKGQLVPYGGGNDNQRRYRPFALAAFPFSRPRSRSRFGLCRWMWRRSFTGRPLSRETNANGCRLGSGS